MTEKIEDIVAKQIEAISKIKIDKVTVWDSGNGDTSSTANFLSGLVKSLPPLHDIAGMAGVDLPQYLGEIAEKAKEGGKERKPAPQAEPRG
jgi:flotillin